ncbi:MAG: hypothetical protein LBW77_05440 [Verrucomicrobiota bacterium]|jgi:hypothetical protein|nr:hypothetical protein [Verrucomicrobiota bacterium]
MSDTDTPKRTLLDEVAGGLEFVSSDIRGVFHVPTRTVIPIPIEYLSQAEDRDGQDSEEDEELEEALHYVRHRDEYLDLPDQYEIHDYAIMESFVSDCEDARDREKLENAIRGSGAFRRFNSTVIRLGLEEAWYAFRGQTYQSIARKWLKSHNLSEDENRPLH